MIISNIVKVFLMSLLLAFAHSASLMGSLRSRAAQTLVPGSQSQMKASHKFEFNGADCNKREECMSSCCVNWKCVAYSSTYKMSGYCL